MRSPTCPVCRTAEIVCGKWTLLLVRDLAEGRSRFCELERSLTGISPRTLSLRLRALEEEGIVRAHTYPEVPPRVEYALTEKGVRAAADHRVDARVRGELARRASARPSRRRGRRRVAFSAWPRNDCDRDWLEHTDAVLRGAGPAQRRAGRSAVVEHLARQRCLVTRAGDRRRAARRRAPLREHRDRLPRAGDAARVRARPPLRRRRGRRPLRAASTRPATTTTTSCSTTATVEAFEDASSRRRSRGSRERLGLDLTGHDVILRARRRG